MCPCGKEGQWHSGLHWEKHCQQVKGGHPFPLLSSGKVTSEVLYPVLSCPVQERHGHSGTGPVQDHEDG